MTAVWRVLAGLTGEAIFEAGFLRLEPAACLCIESRGQQYSRLPRSTVLDCVLGGWLSDLIDEFATLLFTSSACRCSRSSFHCGLLDCFYRRPRRSLQPDRPDCSPPCHSYASCVRPKLRGLFPHWWQAIACSRKGCACGLRRRCVGSACSGEFAGL